MNPNDHAARIHDGIQLSHLVAPPNGLIKYEHCPVCLHIRPPCGFTKSCKGPTKLRKIESGVKAEAERWLGASS